MYSLNEIGRTCDARYLTRFLYEADFDIRNRLPALVIVKHAAILLQHVSSQALTRVGSSWVPHTGCRCQACLQLLASSA
jgi:hypothetical protein